MNSAAPHVRLIVRLLGAAWFLALPLPAWPAAAVAQTSPTAPTNAPTAAFPGAPAATIGDVERLRERAAAFWAARVAHDPTKQWELLEPRGQGRVTAAEYGGVVRAVKYLAYQVEDANVHGYFAKVKVRLIVQPVLPSAPQRRVAPAAVVIEDSWVRVRGTWYRTLEQEDGRNPVGAQQ